MERQTFVEWISICKDFRTRLPTITDIKLSYKEVRAQFYAKQPTSKPDSYVPNAVQDPLLLLVVAEYRCVKEDQSDPEGACNAIVTRPEVVLNKALELLKDDKILAPGDIKLKFKDLLNFAHSRFEFDVPDAEEGWNAFIICEAIVNMINGLVTENSFPEIVYRLCGLKVVPKGAPGAQNPPIEKDFSKWIDTAHPNPVTTYETMFENFRKLYPQYRLTQENEAATRMLYVTYLSCFVRSDEVKQNLLNAMYFAEVEKLVPLVDRTVVKWVNRRSPLKTDSLEKLLDELTIEYPEYMSPFAAPNVMSLFKGQLVRYLFEFRGGATTENIIQFWYNSYKPTETDTVASIAEKFIATNPIPSEKPEDVKAVRNEVTRILSQLHRS